MAKTSPYAALQGVEVKLLEGGGRKTWVSERLKRVAIWGMLVSMGGLLGWLATEKTRAEGLVEPTEPQKKRKKAVMTREREEKRPGVFVWGSNRYRRKVKSFLTDT